MNLAKKIPSAPPTAITATFLGVLPNRKIARSKRIVIAMAVL